MKDLNRKALIAIVRTFVILAAVVFLSAWTLDYWQGWACLAAFFVPATAITVYVARYDPALLERRLKAGPGAEKEKGQKIVQVITSVAFLADFVIPVLDHRFGWSSVPGYACIAGDALMVLGFVITLEVFKTNTYTSGIIEVMAEQKVISTGPYAVVRHPMYAGALIMLFGIPLALGSLWGLLVNVPLTGAIVWRLLDEERFLAGKLAGYREYCQNVKFRLAPFVW
jgi:protein-S-isoprenylcysteine O-methyltransferase Ste14